MALSVPEGCYKVLSPQQGQSTGRQREPWQKAKGTTPHAPYRKLLFFLGREAEDKPSMALSLNNLGSIVYEQGGLRRERRALFFARTTLESLALQRHVPFTESLRVGHHYVPE